jgi:glycosyltransferase involved in cell wall biosynthesis
MANAIADAGCAHTILAWGNRNDAPKEITAAISKWIPYAGGTWKSDLAIIPWLVASNKIDLVHYWIAMGPIFRIGMGFIPFCKSLATVHDVGVENNDYNPYCVQTRTTWYWRFQKLALRYIDAAVCNSQATQHEINRLLRRSPKARDVIYPPVDQEEYSDEKRETVFVTLGGALHKNLARVIDAFLLFKQTRRNYTLVVCGESGAIDANRKTAHGVSFESMQSYPGLLQRGAGLVLCSTYEGLGMPPLEGMSRGCPLVLSDIAPFHETCDAAARFVDPENIVSIAEGLGDVANDTQAWAQRSHNGFRKYCGLSGRAGSQWIALYDALSK